MPKLTEVIHPLVQHKLSLVRDKTTSQSTFRQLVGEIGMLLAYEVTRDLRLTYRRIETPVTSMEAPILDGKEVVLVSILRAGNGMLDGILKIIPSAKVGHIGLVRDPNTLQPKEYYFKVPASMEDRDVLLLDPMVGTGNSAIAAVNRLLVTRPRSIKLICLLAAPEGVKAFHGQHPNIPIYCAKLDERLSEKGYIVPGLGDAGDRLFGTE
ncbi:MAG: uracil phosphoribosyltransferase [Myxococcales bacterium]|nr:uracil phosphoribosyltransferase [Myxococcales bacterium]